MNRKYFGYAGLAIFIAICLCISSSAPAETSRRRCTVAIGGLTCDRGGWIHNGDWTEHLAKCTAGHWYWKCEANYRYWHARRCGRRSVPLPQHLRGSQTTRQTTSQTTSQTTTRQTTTRTTTTRQSQSQSPSRPAQNTPANPPQESCKRPTLTLKKLVIGRSATDSPGQKVPITFITDTKTSCKVKAEITYYGSQPPNTCEITSGSWAVTMTHGFRVSGQASETTEGSGYSKVWKYEATFTDSRSDVISSSSDKYAARSKERIRLNLTFTGTHSGGTVTKSAQVTQDQIDGMRQEYIDYNLHRTLKVLPSRGWFRSTLSVTAPDGSSTFTVSPRDSDYDSYKKTFPGRERDNQEAFYNWGHYDYVIDSKTEANYAIWMQHVDKVQPGLRGEIITCRYRPPHHNKRVGGVIHSTHQYGYALDVRGKRKADGTKMIATERVRMRDAAYDKFKQRETADARLAYISGIPHVHADWAPTWWDAHRKSSSAQLRDMTAARDARRPSTTSNNGGSDDDDDEDEDEDDGADSGTSTDTAPAAPAAPTTSTPTTVACGYSRCALGGRASSRTAHQSTCPRGHVFWTCKRGTGYGNDYHGDRTCVRSGCGETFTRCSNAHRGSNPCRFNRGGWHTD